MTKSDPTFILRVLAAVAPDQHDDIWWRVDEKYAPVTFFVKCNDLFFWGSADCEELTPDNIALLEQSYADAKAIDDLGGSLYGSSLFCARARKERPQGAAYPDSYPALWPLFDACGPERETGFGNPYKPGERAKRIAEAKVAGGAA